MGTNIKMTKEKKILLNYLLKQYLTQSRIKNGKYFIALENDITVNITFSIQHSNNIKFGLAIKHTGQLTKSKVSKYIIELPIEIMHQVEKIFRKYRVSYGITKYGMGNPAVSTIESVESNEYAANEVYRYVDAKLKLFSKGISARVAAKETNTL